MSHVFPIYPAVAVDVECCVRSAVDRVSTAGVPAVRVDEVLGITSDDHTSALLRGRKQDQLRKVAAFVTEHAAHQKARVTPVTNQLRGSVA